MAKQGWSHYDLTPALYIASDSLPRPTDQDAEDDYFDEQQACRDEYPNGGLIHHWEQEADAHDA